MAFRTNKVPAIEERTVSGSSVSFNSAFALPLKACKVSFSATQAGSGEPSPSNPRAISGVSAIGLTANSTPVSVSLGEERYGGYVDVVSKKMYITHSLIDLSIVGYTKLADAIFYASIANIKFGTTDLMCSQFAMKGTGISKLTTDYSMAMFGTSSNRVTFRCDAFSSYTGAQIRTAMAGIDLRYELGTPIEIDLSSIPDLSTIIGNNTFSTDTGTLEITFSDLQEKSASGSVATFNTALAMPLASCNIAVNAWQEGSGDPSPDNVRPIHGWTECNLANMSDSTKAQFFKGLLNGTYGFVDLGTLDWKYEPNLTYPRFVTIDIIADANTYGRNYVAMGYEVDNAAITGTDKDNTIWLYVSQKLFIHNFTYTSVDSFKSAMSGVYLIYELTTPTTPTITKAQFEMLLNAFGISGELYTIQLGQEVYGAEVDVVNGVAHVTHAYLLFDGNENGWRDVTYYGMRSAFINNVLPSNENRALGISNMSKDVGTHIQSSGAIWVGANNKEFDWIGILDTLDLTIEQFTTWLNSHNLQVVYKLTNPFDIQLTPTQIETIIGNNTIFADTGDVDLTYKDLDIAKRGNFREVFKLPS